jgi:hypothetical protein
LLQVLLAAEAGGSPLMAADGSIAMPAWAEQRRSPRIAVEQCGTLVAGSRSWDIDITDVSVGGIGVLTDKPLRQGECVVVVLDRNMALPGKVMWTNQRRAGIGFDQLLVDDAPAYRFLAQRQRAD